MRLDTDNFNMLEITYLLISIHSGTHPAITLRI